MYSATLQKIIKKLPRERDAIEGIDRILATSDDDDEFTAERLYAQVNASSMDAMLRILFELTEAHILDVFMTVETPSGPGLGPYYSYREIPKALDDPYSPSGRRFRVSPGDIRIHYRRHSAAK